ncbi:MAG: polysaccharide biosynthesis tyrosine autokinase [Acidimicrobiales bacterium]
MSGGDDVVVRQKDARDYARILWRRKWYIVLALVIAVGGMVAELRLHQRQYQASAAVLTQVPSSGAVDQTVIATEIGILESSAVEAIVAKHIDDPGTISASQAGVSGIIYVSATSTSPTLAARQANAWAAAYVSYRRSLSQSQALGSSAEIQRQIQSLQQQITSLNAQIAFGGPTSNAEATNVALRNALLGQQVSLQSELQQAQQAAAAAALVPAVVSPAAVPTDPIGLSVTRAVLIGIGAGLLLGVLLAFLFEYLDDSITTRDDLESELSGQVVVIGAIPELARRRNDVAGVVARGDVRSSAVEAYRTVRTTLQFVGVDGEGNVVQVAAPTRGEGATTTAANLAVLMARAGRRVVLVDADLRHPRLHELFGVANRVGLTSLLIGDAATVEALQPVPELESLVVMPVGPLPPNPSELLTSPRFGEVIGRLRDSGVTVVIDSPPVLEASDGMVVAAVSSATVLVTSVRTGSRRRLRRALTLLERAGTPYVGVVLNRAGKEGVVVETARREPKDKRRTGWPASEILGAAHQAGDADLLHGNGAGDADLLHGNGAGKIGVDGVQ